MIKWCSNNLLILGLASITLGLAPFLSEPHVWGKIKWVDGGAVGMKPMDWFDLVLHGVPWVLFLMGLAGRLFRVDGSRTTKKY